ncbi:MULTISPECIES: hypothetical protein [Raoultella]|uniref:hypothetical protein n=1 Tax=Raoultella TaxID=160674 RepID=UPI002168C786|nr:MULTISPECIES: hypothetical protein [Raoultella]MCS4273673.1 hypothetical protein [Raoultella sp. BIGb0132]MCS4290302.1 hypothetical protein [Raoultella terrigena]
MPNSPTALQTINITSDWVTIKEAIIFLKRINGKKVNKSDIYKHALHGRISLSIYFPSPIILRRIKSHNKKLKLKPIGNHWAQKLPMFYKKSIFNGNNLTFSTEGAFISPVQRVIDTTLLGYEYVLIQRLLAHSLKIPSPTIGAKNNYGITLTLFGETFQLFEKKILPGKIRNQVSRPSRNIAQKIYKNTTLCNIEKTPYKDYLPAHKLPKDACFVIRYTELEKIITPPGKNKLSSTRISTPLSRLFWLACRHNETISPLINKPYKLLSIFEQWASTDGITDHLSGDTLKTALERGSPYSSFPPK